jgi:voltage-gated potassium channel
MLRVLGMAALVLIFGTLGFALIEGWTLFESFYFTVISVTTVGYGEVHELSSAGRVLVVLVISGGVLTTVLAANLIGLSMLSNFQLRNQKKMQRILNEMCGHVILCGYGRLGQIVRGELEETSQEFVVIERDEVLCQDLTGLGVPNLEGDATIEEVLLAAGIERASGVIAAIGSDAGNVFITLTARQFNADCPIVARAENQHTAQKLKLVGATSVVTPYQLGGKRLAQAFLHPGAVDLADLAMGSAEHEVLIEELKIRGQLPRGCSTLRELNLGHQFGLIAVAVRSVEMEKLQFNPTADQNLQLGDQLMVMGQRANIDACAEFLGQLNPTG